MAPTPAPDGDVSATEVLDRARRVPVGQLAWRDRDGSPPRVRPVLPLLEQRGDGRGLVLALTYAEREDALGLAGSPETVLVLEPPATTTGGSSQASGSATWVLRCTATVSEDPDGAVFTDDLLLQELRRRPGSRLLADSPLLRREHPWFLPRLLVRLEVLDVGPLPRSEVDDHLLVVDAHGALHVAAAEAPVTAGQGRAASVPPDPSLPPGPATVAGHALSVDRERTAAWSWTGRWDGVGLDVDRSPLRVGLPPTPSLLARYRAHRTFERACRQGLRDAGVTS